MPASLLPVEYRGRVKLPAVLDPVMGDEGRLYVSEEVIPLYKSLLRDAHLVLPNQFEAEYVAFLPCSQDWLYHRVACSFLAKTSVRCYD